MVEVSEEEEGATLKNVTHYLTCYMSASRLARTISSLEIMQVESLSGREGAVEKKEYADD